jgi:hypothetical protein
MEEHEDAEVSCKTERVYCAVVRLGNKNQILMNILGDIQ